MPHLDELDGSTLVIGGARSGKSAFAESLFAGCGSAVYLATAEPLDEEMAERIARHRSRRGRDWSTVEEPVDIVGAIGRIERSGTPILLDCLTIWLSNLLLRELDAEQEIARLAEAIPAAGRQLVCVTNEVGQGIVPDNRLARRFRDLAGVLNQSAAAAADHVYLVTAGLPQKLK